MIADAFQACNRYHPTVAAGLRSHWIRWAKDMRDYYADLREQPSSLRRRLYQVGQLFGAAGGSITDNRLAP
jgi:hypothetical protein